MVWQRRPPGHEISAPDYEYENIQIAIDAQQDQGYPVRLLTTGTGETKGKLFLEGWQPSGLLQEDGLGLTDRLFGDRELGALWKAAFAAFPHNRVQLAIEPPELQTLPWELLQAPDGQVLSVSATTPFARVVRRASRGARPVTELPLRLLVAVANPEGLGDYQLAPLDIEMEQAIIRETAAEWITGAVEVDFLPSPVTLPALDEALRQGYHGLHLVCHSAYSTKKEETVLFFADEKGQPQLVNNKRFSSLLARQRQQLRFIFFGVGQSSTRSSATPDLALEAVRAGTPAAVILQGAVPLQEMRTFAGVFYRQLLEHGQVDSAANEARSRLQLESSQSWPNFVVVTGLRDQQLFDPSILSSVTTPVRKRQPVTEQKTEEATRPELDDTDRVEPESETGPLVGTLGGASNDEIAQEDHLGFDQYVETFARLIASRGTSPPITIGIFGSWGMGKSFLLEHIKRRLTQTSESGERDRPKIHVIEFNAWEYSANEAIWPGLVRKIMKTLEHEIDWGLFDERVRRRIWHNFKGQVLQQLPQLVIGAATLIAILTIFIWQFGADISLLGSMLTALGITGVLGLIKLIVDTVTNPFSQWITILFQEESKYGKPIDYMTRIREDLDTLEGKLGPDERILVLIDDLDRCEPDKAVEVLQAIKLLLTSHSSKFIVCLGIDARVITRAVEKYYEDMLGPSGASGYEYLDKIIQIPFRIPAPNQDEIREFINKEMGEPLPPLLGDTVALDADDLVTGSPEAGKPTLSSLPGESGTEVRSSQETEQSDAEPSLPQEEAEVFTYHELEAFQSMARFLRPNPRHIKRLLNVYRLVRTLAQLKQQRFILDNPATIICWLVICGQWPYTSYRMLQRYNEMLEDIDEGTLTEWPEGDPLVYLLQQTQVTLVLEKQFKLDHDPDLLRQLLANVERNLNWSQLRIVRQYTINFNPAVEAELHQELVGEGMLPLSNERSHEKISVDDAGQASENPIAKE